MLSARFIRAAAVKACRVALRDQRKFASTTPMLGAFEWDDQGAFALSLAAGALWAAVISSAAVECEEDLHTGAGFESHQAVSNWSATHSCVARKLFEPQSTQEVLRILQFYQENKMKLRPVGTALSPNGIGLTDGGSDLLTMRCMNHISVNVQDSTVTVGAGATVQSVLAELKKSGLTLENFSSIQEQQMAGWTQVAAHGTGVTLATVEEQIVELRLATPGEGLLTLSAQKDPRLFSLAKVGLGSLGVVTDMKLRCVPLMQLLEKTACIDRSAVFNDHINRLADCRHVRYMWIPYTDTVVTVCSNPTEVAVAPVSVGSAFSQLFSATTPTSAVAVGGPAAQQMFDLLNKSRADSGVDGSMKGLSIDKMSVADLRSELLDATPLNLDVCSVSPAVDFTHSKAVNPQHVKAVNRAEAAYWRSSQGSREASSTEILGFDCGGEQLVYEVCIPMGRLSMWQSLSNPEKSKSPDILFVEQLLSALEDSGIPAPSPIEQRWTARSTSPMSPAYSLDPEAVFSWIGIIMYLPQDPERRIAVTNAFRKYCTTMNFIVDQYGGQAHWAKIELPLRVSSSADGMFDAKSYEEEIGAMRNRILKKFPVTIFNEYRNVLDPENVLSNQLIDELISK